MKAIRTISAILLAILVLVSSTSFTVGLHFCQGEVQHVALFGKPEKCENEVRLPPCHRQMKATCCADKTFIHESDDFKHSAAHTLITLPAPSDLEQPLVLVSEVIPSAPVAIAHSCPYDPPLRSCNLTVEHRVFQI